MVRSIVVATLLLLPLASAGCKGPCERAVDRTIQCVSSGEIREKLEERRHYAVKLCSPFEDGAASCLKEESCSSFLKCMERVTSSLRFEMRKKGRDATPAE